MQAKMVIIVQQPDGTVEIKAFERETDTPMDISKLTVKDTKLMSAKGFQSLPTRLKFLFEKNFRADQA